MKILLAVVTSLGMLLSAPAFARDNHFKVYVNASPWGYSPSHYSDKKYARRHDRHHRANHYRDNEYKRYHRRYHHDHYRHCGHRYESKHHSPRYHSHKYRDKGHAPYTYYEGKRIVKRVGKRIKSVTRFH